MPSILIIDDDEQVRMILQRALTAAGHTVITACDGAEAVRLYRAEPTDLVITDVFMPNQEGLGTIMELRREYPGLGIIAMSGSSSRSPSWLTVAAHLGVHRTLAKPFTMAQLTEAVAEVLRACPDPLAKV